MRQSILKAIREAKDVTNAIILTHNIDFVFLQSVVLGELRRCGHPRLTVFADAQCALSSYEQQGHLLDSLGSRFRVVPVSMRPGFRFHPKALLLSSPVKAILFVGSGNLTFGGWRENAEVWLRYDTDSDGLPPFVAFHSYLDEIASATPLRETVAAEIEEAFDKESRPWAAAPAEPGGLLGRMGTGEALLSRMKTAAGATPVERLVVCSPYFDDEAVALRKLSEELQAKATVVFAQKRQSGLLKSAADQLTADFCISTVDFLRKDAANVERSSFMHAKFYALERQGSVTVFAGSANCSKAALTISGNAGNAEILARVEMSPANFKQEFLDEIVFLQEDPVLPTGEKLEVEPPALPALRLLAARHFGGVLRAGFQAPSDCEITRCLVDGVPQDFACTENRVVEANFARAPRTVQLAGRIEDAAILSNLMWVDDENALLSSAWTRNLDQQIRDRVREGHWDIDAWTRIMEVFCKHAQYMPRSHRAIFTALTPRATGTRATSFSRADVYSEGYGLPSIDQLGISLAVGGRTSSLQQTLLHWFGLAVPASSNGDSVDELDDEGGTDDSELGEQQTDRPEILKAQMKTPSHNDPTANDRRKATQILERVTTALTTGDYLGMRGPAALVADMKIAAALFQSALREGWIGPEVYCRSSAAIWTALFISRGDEEAVGWIEHRHQTAADPDAFAEALVSVQLTVALATWALAVPDIKDSPERSIFALAAAYSVARLPWLWHVGKTEEIGREMAALLRDTGALSQESLGIWEQARTGWTDLIRRGTALQDFEKSLHGHTADKLAAQIKQYEIRLGELLWQAKEGFLVAEEAGNRSRGGNLTLRHLATNKPKRYSAQYLLPLAGLMDCPAVTIPPEARAALGGLVREVSCTSSERQ